MSCSIGKCGFYEWPSEYIEIRDTLYPIYCRLLKGFLSESTKTPASRDILPPYVTHPKLVVLIQLTTTCRVHTVTMTRGTMARSVASAFRRWDKVARSRKVKPHVVRDLCAVSCGSQRDYLRAFHKCASSELLTVFCDWRFDHLLGPLTEANIFLISRVTSLPWI